MDRTIGALLGQRFGKARSIVQIAAQAACARGLRPRPAHQRADIVPMLGQLGAESLTDETARARDEDAHGGIMPTSGLCRYASLFRLWEW